MGLFYSPGDRAYVTTFEFLGQPRFTRFTSRDQNIADQRQRFLGAFGRYCD